MIVIARFRIARNVAIVAALASVLTACAETESGGTANIFSDVATLTSSGGQSSEQRQLSQVQRDYARARVTGAAGGAVVGGLGAWLAGGNQEQIAAAVAVGGTAGYLGASALTRQNANFQLSRDTLAKDIEAAKAENARMARSVQAAQNVVRYQTSEISRLNAGYNAGSVSAQQYRAKYATMQEDLQTTRALAAESQKRLDSLNQSVSAYQRAGIAPGQLAAERNQQQARVNQLKAAEAQIVRNLANVPASVS